MSERKVSAGLHPRGAPGLPASFTWDHILLLSLCLHLFLMSFFLSLTRPSSLDLGPVEVNFGVLLSSLIKHQPLCFGEVMF